MTPAPDDQRNAYATRTAVGRTPAGSKVERELMALTFLAVGPQAPTLCGDWDAHHLAAHLVLRESDLIGAVKSAVPSLGGQAVDDLVRRSPFEYLVHQFRNGPPPLSFFRLPTADRRFNALEHFIHHEDLRRARDDWSPRTLPRWAEDELWTPLRYLARGIMRHSPVALTLARTDVTDLSVARKGDRPVLLRGLPSELSLYVYGRSQVAEVDVDGDPESLERLRGKRFRM